MDVKKILIVDDDEGLRDNLEDILSEEGYQPFSAPNCSEALKMAKKRRPAAALLDLKLPDGSGTELLAQFRQSIPDCLCIMMTAFADLDSALLALEQGAFQYLQKPVRPPDLLHSLKRLFETIDLREEKRQAEVKLRQSERTIRSLLDALPSAALLVDARTRILACNRGFAECMGKRLDEIIGKRLKNLSTGALFEETRSKTLEVITSKEAARAELTAGERHFDTIISPVFDDKGDVKGAAVFSFDITERKLSEAEKEKLQAQLAQLQKMEAMGTLAGGIAHDYNNLLMGIQGNASLILVEKESGDPDYERLKNIEAYVRSGAALTKQLLGFARGGRYEVEALDINEIVKQSSQMFGRTKKEIAVHTKYQAGIWFVEADRGQLEQVLLNLYVNAWQAMPGGGKLLLETENVTLDERAVYPYGTEPGRYVKIAVTDTGIGMDEATRQRIFDPFFTTKEMGRGTGLGLASAYGIIKNHGGIINVDSGKGQGSTFTLFLPASDKTVTVEKKKVRKLLTGEGTLLLVDDEKMIIDVGRHMLEKMGYRVLVASGGQEAIEIYKKNKKDIKLVILDMIMPEMGGGAVYDRLKAIDPRIKVLLSSGYSVDGEATDILKRGCDGFIQKPFNMKDLSRKVIEILERQG